MPKGVYEHRNAVDLVGQRFGRLTVLSRGTRTGSRGQVYWLCRCECGTEKEIRGSELRNGRTRSCGCANSEALDRSRRSHGMSDYPEYRIWIAMRSRCSNPRGSHWPFYGGRGIKVCERWEQSFEAFYEDMGPRPSPESSIERLDSDGDYTPENCVWASATSQARNTARNRRLTYQGRTQTLSAWAEEFGLSYPTLYARLHTEGLSLGDALTRPLRRHRR